MKVLLLIFSLLPWQNLLQEAKQHYMNYENDSCAVKTARVTTDLDVAIAIRDWSAFDKICAELESDLRLYEFIRMHK